MTMISSHYEQVNLPMILDLQVKDEEEEDDILEEEEEYEEDDDDYEHINTEMDGDYEEEYEEEEEDDDIYYLQDNNDTQHQQQQQQVDFYFDNNQNFIQAANEDEYNDDSFYLANRTFYTTCHKISRQNSPSYRKRPPYTFLENWLIHSVFSKSQQILLRFPVIHPKVMMTEGDFIYTPHQMANNNNNQEQQQYYNSNELQEEEDYDYYDDAFIIGDEGVLVMSASAPDASQFMAADDEEDEENQITSIVMDENMWMGHSRYNTNGLTLHVVNPDNDDDNDDEYDEENDKDDADKIEQRESDPMYHNVLNSNNPYKSLINHGQQLQMVKEEDEEEEEEMEIDENKDEITEENTMNHIHTNNLSISPEVLNWYRSADFTPAIVANNEDKPAYDGQPQQQCINNVNCGCNHGGSSSSSTTSTCSDSSHGSCSSQRTDTRSAADEVEKTTTRHSSESYQSLADIIEEEQLRDYGSLPTHHNRSIVPDSKKVSPIMQVSLCFVDAAWVAMDLAQTYVEKNTTGSKGVTGFVTCLFRIWKVLFLGAETMLGWGDHRLQPQAMV